MTSSNTRPIRGDREGCQCRAGIGFSITGWMERVIERERDRESRGPAGSQDAVEKAALSKDPHPLPHRPLPYTIDTSKIRRLFVTQNAEKR